MILGLRGIKEYSELYSKGISEMNINPLGPYYAGALRTAIASCFINGRISEQQIDFAKEVISMFREAEIDHLAISATEKEKLKSGWRQWLDAFQDIDLIDDKKEFRIFVPCLT